MAELQTSTSSDSQGAVSTCAEITAQLYPAASPAQVLGVLDSDGSHQERRRSAGLQNETGPADCGGPRRLLCTGGHEAGEQTLSSRLAGVLQKLPGQCRGDSDLDKDFMVSREEFIDMRNAICLFVKDDKCQEMLIEVLASLVAAHWKVGGDDNNSVVRLQA